MSDHPLPSLPPETPARLQARLAGVLEAALDCIITVDTKGFVIDFNPAAEKTFGYSKPEAIGREMAELIVPPALRERHRQGMARLAAGDGPRLLGRRVEISAIRRDGTEFPVELTITRVDLGPNEPCVYTAHLRDITERRQMEESLLSLQNQLEQRIVERTAALRESEASLRESQELFSKSFHASPALMSIAQLPGGRLIEINEAFQQATGRPKDEIIGRTTLELDLWCDRAQRDVFLQTLQERGAVHGFEAEFRTSSGRRLLLLNADLIEVRGGRAILTVAVDVSERQRREQAEAALARAEASYRSIFENALEGLYQTSPDGRFLRANPALARMFGYDSPEELIASVNDIGRSLYVEPGRREEFFRLLGQHDAVTDFVSEVYRRDGSRLWVSESVHAMRNLDGTLLYLEGVAIDITAQREAARALAQAKEAADAANRAKSLFLATMSHELRTPLNGILGYTQILARDSSLATAHRRGVDVIHQSAEHLLGLINDVLDLSKVEAGRLELNANPCDLSAFLQGVAELLEPRAQAQGLGFKTSFAPDLPRRVTVDTGRLRQVLLNLLGNALKFTRTGGVTLAVSLGARAAEGSPRSILFAVTDTGPGIAPEDLVRLFQPFVQLGGAGAQTGTGLGLAISRSLVSAMGGHLQVESRPGQGSRFFFELQLPVDGAAAPLSDLRLEQVVGYVGERRCILVVDDHPANREVLEQLLRSVGFDVLTCESGEAALDVCDNGLPDAVLLDLRMDGLSGLETSRELRRRHGQALCIIAVSASAYDLDRQACLDAGCNEFLPKPVKADELWRTLGRCLALTWQHRETAARTTPAPFLLPVVPPPLDAVRELHRLARAGDIVALRHCAETLAQSDPAQTEFVHSVLELADQFKLKAIRQLLEGWRPKDDSTPTP